MEGLEKTQGMLESELMEHAQNPKEWAERDLVVTVVRHDCVNGCIEYRYRIWKVRFVNAAVEAKFIPSRYMKGRSNNHSGFT